MLDLNLKLEVLVKVEHVELGIVHQEKLAQPPKSTNCNF